MFQSTIYSVAFYHYKVTVSVCVGMLLGLGISVCGGFILVIRKLKLKNPSYKEVENRILDIQSHQMSSSSAKTMYSNPIMRFISGFAGNDTPYHQFHATEVEGEDSGRQLRETKPRMKPATAEAGSQVCQEIIGKREKRNNCECFGGEGDGTPREGFIQEIFEESRTSNPGANTTTCSKGTCEQDPRLSAQYTCAVCLDELCLGNTNMTTTGCGHTFHLSCLLKSLSAKNLCPMCRWPLEDVRTKQQPSNMLTPVSAEQIISEEVSYFPNAAHLQSMMTSRHPKRRLKDTLRVFGFVLLRSVAEYIHDENLPTGWYDDGESDGDEDEESDNDDGTGTDTTDATDNDEEGSEHQDSENARDNDDEVQDDEDEFNYAAARQGQIEGRQQQTNQAALRVLSETGRSDLRELIGNSNTSVSQTIQQ